MNLSYLSRVLESRKQCLQESRQAVKQAGSSIKQQKGFILLLIVVNLVWSCRTKPEIQVKCQGYQRACLEGKQKHRQTNKERMRRKDRDKGDMAANNNYCYLSVTKTTTELRITNNKWTVLGSAMWLSVAGMGCRRDAVPQSGRVLFTSGEPKPWLLKLFVATIWQISIHSQHNHQVPNILNIRIRAQFCQIT